MNELHLFAGAGGGILGGQLLGHRPVCAVEWEPYAQAVLVARQNDGTFPPFPIWNDVQTFDGRPWHGIADVVAGGFPCQDISVAGGGAGLDGERSGMWHHMARIIGEVRPKFAFIENSPALLTRGLDRVLCDLAALGFDARWTVMGASDTGAPHKRERIWILARRNGVADPHCERSQQQTTTQALPHQQERIGETHCTQWGQERGTTQPNGAHANVADASGQCREGEQCRSADAQERAQPQQRPAGPRGFRIERWPVEPGLGRVAHGVAHRPNRIKAIGNGQVPRVAAAAFHLLQQQFNTHNR